MTPRQYIQTASAISAVAIAGLLHLLLTPAHPAHTYTWPINALVLSVIALAGYTAGGSVALRWEDKQEERARRAEARKTNTNL